jgi:hypothetical protein
MKPCKCGKDSKFWKTWNLKVFVGCIDSKCWCGPNRDTEEEAKEAWNEIMCVEENHAVRKLTIRLDESKLRNCLSYCDGSILTAKQIVNAIVIAIREFCTQQEDIPGTEADR